MTKTWYILIILLSVSRLLYSQSSNFVCTEYGVIKVNFEDCSAQTIGPPTYFADIAITPSGNLYGVDYYKLFSIDTITGIPIFIADIDSLGGGFNSLLAINDDFLLGVRVNSGLYKISTLNGDTSLIGYLGYYPAGDLTFYHDHYYMADALGQLIRFDLDIQSNTISSVISMGIMNTPLNSVYGIVTIGNFNCNTDNLKLIAFEGTYAYEVNPINANCTLLCGNSLGYTSLGAASSAETNPQQYYENIKMPNVLTPNNDGINDFLSIDEHSNIDEFTVLNRWGQIVFYSNSIPFNWCGTDQKGDELDEGVYFYTYKNKSCSQIESRLLYGSITILR